VAVEEPAAQTKQVKFSVGRLSLKEFRTGIEELTASSAAEIECREVGHGPLVTRYEVTVRGWPSDVEAAVTKLDGIKYQLGY
jgi:hypothetical protein